MKRLHAPWRHDYVTRVSKKKGIETAPKEECIFCNNLQENKDDKCFIIKRFKHCFVMMNLYPYNVGHVMVLPYEHKAELYQLTGTIRAEMMEAVNASTQVLEKVLKPGGFNIGINLGLAGGGGLPAHLHIHILPRWRGDTNFLETLGQIKLLSVELEKTFEDLKAGFVDVSL
jgi:ATP adenylyltransferase